MERKTIDKTNSTNNKINNSKIKKDKNCANFKITNDKKSKNIANKSNNKNDLIIINTN
jgi:hypothetical protein